VTYILLTFLSDGQPTPIEYLPAEHTLDSRVRLLVEYKGRATSTIAVGDELSFKLETLDGGNLVHVSLIFELKSKFFDNHFENCF